MPDDPDNKAVSVVGEDAAPIVSQMIALANQVANPEMFDRMVAWQEREAARAAEEAFNDAMNQVQAEIEPVVRRSENSQTHSFYAKLEHIDREIRPIYLKHGFNVAFNTVPPLVAGNIRVECEISRGRHSKKYYREAPADTVGPQGKAVKTVLHGGGSTETYLKKYAVCGGFNVVFANMDDDGVRGGQRFISEEQAEELRQLCHDAGRIEGQIVQRLFAGAIHSFDEIEQGTGFLAAKSTLVAMIEQQRRKAGA